jgi:transcriptional regulator with XRE-family HTH domain
MSEIKTLPRPEDRRLIGGRLRKAREDAGFKTVREFVLRSGLKYDTYYQHETGRRPLTVGAATLYARLLQVSPAWILTGDTSHRPGLCRIVGEVGNNGTVVLFDTEGGIDPAVVPNADEHLDILRVTDDSGKPFTGLNDLVYFRPLLGYNKLECHGVDCVVRLADGRVLIRQVIAQGGNLATLLAYNGKPELNVEIAAASPVEIVRKRRSLGPVEQQLVAA